jgi:hypothetical protein
MDATSICTHAKKGSDWLIDHQNSDGSWKRLSEPRIDAYYKGAWALATTGQYGPAHRLLTHIRENYLEENGDLGPRGHRAFSDIHHLYPNAYVVVGSAVCGRYDISTRTTRYLLTRQHPRTGGFYSQHGVTGDQSHTDTMSTSAAGVACLAAGELDAAQRAGNYLTSLVERQPEPDESFYYTVAPDGTLRTTFDDDEDSWWGAIRTDEPNQCWYAVGLPFAFLVQLAEATGEERYRETADWYFEFQQSCRNPWSGGSSGKAAWATSMLYRITSDEAYRDIAVDIAENVLIAGQNDDGSWVSADAGAYADREDTEYENADFDVSAEYTLWLALVGSNLLACDGT